MSNTATLAIVIMAAGKGTRLKSKRPKVLHEIGGKPLITYVVAAARQFAPANDIYVIVGHEAASVRAAVESTDVQFVFQVEQRGPGHAIMRPPTQTHGYTNILVLSGPLLLA